MNIILINKDFKKCREEFNVDIINDNIYLWHFIINPQTEYFNKNLRFKLEFDNNYPFEAPKLFALDFIFHPNIDVSGNICLGVLNNWNKKYNAYTILNALRELLISPDFTSPINVKAVALWNNKDRYLEELNYL
jgi:ubiquitin-protein ligase